MISLNFMVIAGEPSGDLLAAELVKALKAAPETAGARFFGAGGPAMEAAGVELAFDLTQHAVVGLWEVIRNYSTFRRLFHELLRLALERKPDSIICVDYSGFNRRFAHAVRQRTAGIAWRPKIVQFVSPQVWASRPGRADAMARDLDLVLSIFRFEKEWYAQRVPELRVEFVGHPICDRFDGARPATKQERATPLVLLLPGSRAGELKRHLPILREAVQFISASVPASFRMVLSNDVLAAQARRELGASGRIELQVGGLPQSLAESTVAIASTGTVTMECAYFGVPTVTLYKTSWLTYEVGRRLIKVTSLTMPNLLAGEPIFPEFIQGEATGINIGRAATALLKGAAHRQAMRVKLETLINSLGGPGASRRAAGSILSLLKSPFGSSG
jgi:lipid-A-disaccharide synthase